MVAVFNLNKKPRLRNNLESRIDIDPSADPLPKKLDVPGPGPDMMTLTSSSLNVRGVEHHDEYSGLEHRNANTDQGSMCFGCWSAGFQKKCQLHEGDRKLKLLCRNWDLSIMRRRHCAEETQEAFLRKKSSLRFISKHKKFLTVIEHKHQIYLELNHVIDHSNFKFASYIKIKRWMFPLVGELRKGH